MQVNCKNKYEHGTTSGITIFSRLAVSGHKNKKVGDKNQALADLNLQIDLM
jgi:hypothetical protein